MSARGLLQRRRFTACALAAATLAASVAGGCSGGDEPGDEARRAPATVDAPTSTSTDDAASDPSVQSNDDQLDGDGDESAGLRTTAGSTIPPDFPGDVPLPAGHAVSLATVTTGQGGRTIVVQLRAPGDPASTLTQLATSLEAAGWTRLQLSTSEVDGSTAGSATFSKAAAMLHLGTVAAPEPGLVTVSYSLLPDGQTPTTIP